MARATGAYKVMFLTDVAGWLRDPADPASVVSECGADEVEAALAATAGGMRPKLQACIDAIHGGVSFAHIIDGRQPHSLLLELFTDAGVGTGQAGVVSALAPTYARYPVEFVAARAAS